MRDAQVGLDERVQAIHGDRCPHRAQRALHQAQVHRTDHLAVLFGQVLERTVAQPDLARASALAVGPGLGRSDVARDLVRGLLERSTLPAVVDADGLFALAPVARDAATVLTPHTGELARLLDTDPAWVSAHRLEAAAGCADRFGAVVVLKGADTIVRAPGGRTVVCDVGPLSLATAGTGDVLTGVLGAFLAKGLDAIDAAVAAAIAHGLAARAVPNQAGLIASDVVEALPSKIGRASCRERV